MPQGDARGSGQAHASPFACSFQMTSRNFPKIREITHRLNFVPQGNCSWDCCHDNSPQHKTVSGQLSNYEGNGNENSIKSEFAFYQTFRFYLSSKQFLNAGKFSSSWILQCCNFIQKDKENSSLYVHILQKHHIALQSRALDLKEMYQKG